MSDRIQRRGAVYVVVLLASLIVASLAIAALRLAHVYARDLNREVETYQVQISADAALEWAIARINADTAWRSNHLHNVDVLEQVFGDTTICYRLVDSTGDLAADPTSSCDIVVTAKSRTSTFAWRGTLEPMGPPLNCLEYAIASGNDIGINDFSMMCTDGRVASRGTISAQTSGSLTADCFAANGCVGEIIGTTNGLNGPQELPNSDALLELYASLGTPILASQIPVESSALQLNGVLLSPNANSNSEALDPQGVYVIDCVGQRIVISN